MLGGWWPPLRHPSRRSRHRPARHSRAVAVHPRGLLRLRSTTRARRRPLHQLGRGTPHHRHRPLAPRRPPTPALVPQLLAHPSRWAARPRMPPRRQADGHHRLRGPQPRHLIRWAQRRDQNLAAPRSLWCPPGTQSAKLPRSPQRGRCPRCRSTTVRPSRNPRSAGPHPYPPPWSDCPVEHLSQGLHPWHHIEVPIRRGEHVVRAGCCRSLALAQVDVRPRVH